MNVYIVLHVHDMYMSCHECVSMLHVMYMHTASKLMHNIFGLEKN